MKSLLIAFLWAFFFFKYLGGPLNTLLTVYWGQWFSFLTVVPFGEVNNEIRSKQFNFLIYSQEIFFTSTVQTPLKYEYAIRGVY